MKDSAGIVLRRDHRNNTGSVPTDQETPPVSQVEPPVVGEHLTPEPSGEPKVNQVESADVPSKGGHAEIKAPHLVVVSEDADNANRMGPRLQAARENLGLSIDEIADKTRIQKDYIRAIEKMQPESLPGMPQSQSYLRGWLRTYATAVHMKDVDEVVWRYLDECDLIVRSDVPQKTIKPKGAVRGVETSRYEDKEQKPIGSSLLMLIALTTLGGAIGFYAFDGSDTPVKTDDSIAGALQVGAGDLQSSPSPLIDTASTLAIRALAPGWIEVRGSDGTVYLSKNMERGEIYVPRVGAGWTVTVHDGGAFEWRLAGESLGSLGNSGLRVNAGSIDAVVTRAGKQ